MEKKRCTTCGADKAHSEFYKSKKSADGLRYQCKDCAVATLEAWRAENPDAYKEQRKRGRKQYKERNPEKVKAQKERTRVRKLATHSGRLDADIRFVLNANIRAIKKYGTDIYGLLGFDAHDLMAHLEKSFAPGMSWDTYKNSGWHIDHRIPLSGNEYTHPSSPDFEKVWSIENLQPLWAAENIAKGNKLDFYNAT